MNAKTIVVAARSGTGVQTVTGVTNSSGALFIPEVFLIHGNSAADTLATFCRMSYGQDDLISPRGQAFDETAEFGGKIVSGCAGNKSILDERGSVFFGGAIERQAYISAARLGEFDITYTVNNRTGDSFIVTALGGTDFQGKIGISPTADVYTVGFAPEAVIGQQQAIGSSPPATSGGAGGSLGWATKTSGMGTSAIAVVAQGGNARYQVSTLAGANLDQATLGAISASGTVTDFGSDSFTLSNTSFSGSYSFLAVGGGILARAGIITQPLIPGSVTTITGITNRLVLLMSVGAVASTSVRTDRATLSIGSYDGTTFAAHLVGDATVGNPPSTGFRYLSTADIGLMGTPNGGSTSLTTKVQGAGFSEANSSFTLSFSSVDGTALEWYWLALGETPVPVVPPIPGCVPGLSNGAPVSVSSCVPSVPRT